MIPMHDRLRSVTKAARKRISYPQVFLVRRQDTSPLGPLSAGDLFQALLSPVETSFTRLEERGRNLPFPFGVVVGNHGTIVAFFK